MKLKNRIIYLDLKFKDKEDNFDKGESRPFLIYRQLSSNKFLLIPITSKKKRKSTVWQYLVSAPKKYLTCLTSKKYPYSYAILNRKINLRLKSRKGFLPTNFCRKHCQSCLSTIKFTSLTILHSKYWKNSYNWISTNRSRVKEINITL